MIVHCALDQVFTFFVSFSDPVQRRRRCGAYTFEHVRIVKSMPSLVENRVLGQRREDVCFPGGPCNVSQRQVIECQSCELFVLYEALNEAFVVSIPTLVSFLTLSRAVVAPVRTE